MKNKTTLHIRSFLGAFLGAACAIWPAATWNEAWLLLVGGFIGWMAGYHGGLIFSSLLRGWLYARRIGFRASFYATARMLGITPLVERGSARTRRVWHLICVILLVEIPMMQWLLAVMSFLSWAISSAISSTLSSPQRFMRWRGEHDMNKAAVIRFFAALVVVSPTMFFLWRFGIGLSDTPGSTYVVNGMTHVVAQGEVYLKGGLSVVFAGFLPAMLAANTYTDERGKLRGFYSVWERYDTRGTVLFFLGELIRYSWILAWVYFTAIAGVVFILTGMFLGLIVGGLAWTGFVYSTRLAWRAMRLNRSYGVVSLGVALVVGVTTFYAFRGELVADPLFRLVASVGAGAFAGLLSVGIDYLCGIVFSKSIAVRRLALRPKARWSMSPFDFFLDIVPAAAWSLNKRLLPA